MFGFWYFKKRRAAKAQKEERGEETEEIDTTATSGGVKDRRVSELTGSEPPYSPQSKPVGYYGGDHKLIPEMSPDSPPAELWSPPTEGVDYFASGPKPRRRGATRDSSGQITPATPIAELPRDEGKYVGPGERPKHNRSPSNTPLSTNIDEVLAAPTRETSQVERKYLSRFVEHTGEGATPSRAQMVVRPLENTIPDERDQSVEPTLDRCPSHTRSLMRLLKRLPDGDFQLVLVRSDDPPPYAILSHTWAEGEEVTYGELVAGAGKHKTGYAKIRFCNEQAAADGLEYCWVDTCCIDKSTSDELSTAINSMFRWYQHASKCYVYLSDVSVPDEISDAEAFPIAWQEVFRRSRWFTRGWTLQELLAPADVEFFSKQGKRLGTRVSLEHEIHEITQIPIAALRGQPLSDFSVEDRMDWAAGRTTTRQEDKVYCLLGIFDVFLPLIYGEGEAYATLRLKEEIQTLQLREKVSGKEHSHTLTSVERLLTDSGTGANAESLDKTPEALAQALAHRDSSAVQQLLEHEFDNVARGKYEWLHELIDVGHSWYEIAGLLLEEANDAPWIYFDSEDQPFQDLNSQSLAMTAQDSLETTSISSPWMSKRHDVRTLIQRLCGLGGIAPTSRSLHDWNGEAIFEENFSTSYISYASSSQNIEVTHQSTVVSRLRHVLKDFCKAVAALQSANMCREDFTIARICVPPTVPRHGNVELKKVDIALAIALSNELDRLPSSISSGMLDLMKPLDIAWEILRPLLPQGTAFFTQLHTIEESLHICCLAAQFLCVGLVSFCQGHVGPIESVFTNYSQERSILLGNRTLNGNPWHLCPYIAVRLSKLTCLGQMVEGPLITFSMSNEWPRGGEKTHDVVREALLDREVTKLSQLGLDDFFADQSEHHVEATPHDILYTWGPGRLIPSEQDESSLQAIRIGGGIIYLKDKGGTEFHWEAGPGPSKLPSACFHCQSKITVGALVMENTTQCSFPWQTWRASCTLVYLAVEPERWDPNQRQIGLQAGPDHIALQAMQVWTKVPAKLLKQYQLRHDHFDMVEFLGCYVGVQVSCCTGVSRRISLQELLSDLMPKYCVTYMSEAGWNDWNTKYNILTGLRSSDVREWLFELRRHLVEVCDDLFRTVHRILKVLEPTGLNRTRTHIQIAWPKEGDFLRGIKVSCKDKHLWAQALADSEEGVTFAYMTTKCLLCVGSSCQQREQVWKMRPKCLGTAVTRYRNELEQESQSGPWALQDGQVYHMWNEKRYIRMKADVVGSPHRLIASESAIPSYIALRHFRGRRYRAKNLIRERHHPDDAAVDVLLLDEE